MRDKKKELNEPLPFLDMRGEKKVLLYMAL